MGARMQRKVVIGIAALASFWSATSIAASAQELPPPPHVPQGAAFSVGCRYSHSGPFDPIVDPGNSAGSHLHDFLGNTGTNENSTSSTLRPGPTNCRSDGDRSAYWVPSLFQRQLDGTFKHFPPVEVTIYYEGFAWGDHQRNAQVEPIPEGLVMITGESTATSPQPQEKVVWYCGGGIPQGPYGAPNCAPDPTYGGTPSLWAIVSFPSCWDGRLDSGNHKDHLTHTPHWLPCPISHPTRIARIKMIIRYAPIWGGPDAEVDGSPGAIKLSSAGGTGDGRAVHSMHADFMEGWDGVALQQAHRACITLSACGVGF